MSVILNFNHKQIKTIIINNMIKIIKMLVTFHNKIKQKQIKNHNKRTINFFIKIKLKFYLVKDME